MGGVGEIVMLHLKWAQFTNKGLLQVGGGVQKCQNIDHVILEQTLTKIGPVKEAQAG